MKHPFPIRRLLSLTLASILGSLGCSSSNGTRTPPLPPTGMVSLCFTGTSSEDWSELDFKLVGITLTPEAGTTPVTLLAAPAGGIPFNLVQLDHLGELLGNFSVPVGQYTGATLTLSTASNDVGLNVASVPSPGFLGTGNDRATPSFTWIENNSTSPTLSLSVPFSAPLVVTTEHNIVLDLHWDSARPTFLNGAAIPNNGAVEWTLDFDHALSQRTVTDPTQLPLLPVYGAVFEVAQDRHSFQLFPSFSAGTLGIPVVLPQMLVVTPDAVNGTQFIDIDAGSSQLIKDLSTIGNPLPGRTVRVGGQLQSDGSLVASRIWAGTASELGTELSGRITSVDSATSYAVLDGDASTQNGYITGAQGFVNATTTLTILNPLNAADPVATIPTGTGFMAASNLARGFLVHPVIQWAQTPGVSTAFASMDIESANFKGSVTSVDGSGITCSCPTGSTVGNMTVSLPYLAQTTANGNDAMGIGITGFKWWSFSSPTQINSGQDAAGTFAAAAASTVDFGGTVGVIQAWVTTHAAWGDAANPSGWSAQYSILEPLPLPPATVSTGWTPTGTGGSFGITLPSGANTVTVDVLGTRTPTEVYQVFESGPNSSFGSTPQLNPFDLTTPAGQAALTSLLAKGAAVQVFGIPGANGHILAGVVFCYTYTQ